jgi:hypothetical protein
MGGGRGERGWQNGSIFLGQVMPPAHLLSRISFGFIHVGFIPVILPLRALQDEIREALLPSEYFSGVGGRAPVVEAEPVVPPPLHLNCVQPGDSPSDLLSFSFSCIYVR